METMKHCSNKLLPVKCVSSTLPLTIALLMSRPAQLCSVSVLLLLVKPPHSYVTGINSKGAK
eukprot:12607724-Heterocapsa_arctica.AAC.1